jgi:DNA polymerase III delta prime subunit
VLENSLHKAALIDLGMAYQPDAVAYPWEMVVERPDATPQPLPQGTPIASVFDELRGELLILGSPGSGKTTMLLELARTLIERAQQQETHPIPVVFNLSSWAEKQPPLADWLVEELNARYDVPRKVGQAWIDHDQVLPLLDGLDEVRQDARDSCVAAINAYRQEHGLVGMVVCSRVADYAALTAKLKLRGAIMVQPLTDEQIDSYLAQTGAQLVAVQTLLHEDAEMRVFANTPLMLSIMSLAYRGIPPHELPEQTSLDARRRHLFDTYVERMLKRRGSDQQYTPEQTRHWLSWLAGRMVEHGQTVFYLERMQPDWLTKRRWMYRVATFLGISVIGGVASGVAAHLILNAVWIVSMGLLLGDWSVRWSPMAASPTIFMGFVYGMLFGGAFVLRMGNILPVERLRWSWRAFGMRIPRILLLSLLIGLTVSVFESFVLPFTSGYYGLLFALVYAISAGLSGGLIADEVPENLHTNQGIQQSVKLASWSAAIIAISTLLVVGMVNWVLMVSTSYVSVSWEAVLRGIVPGMLSTAGSLGLLFGGAVLLFIGLAYGGLAVMRHYALRLVLALSNHAPLNYVPFLDHAAERILLRKVGGGYIFVHRMLLEYFASLEEEQRNSESEAAQ